MRYPGFGSPASAGALAALAPLLALVAPLFAQEPSRGDSLLPPGTHVRVTVDARRPVVGDVLWLRGDTLAFQARPARDRLLDYRALIDSITVLEVRTGTRMHVGRSVLRGVLIGGGIGLVIGVAAAVSGDDSGWFDYGAAYIPLGVAGGVLFGGAIGVLSGIGSREAIWEPVPVGSLRVGVGTAPRGGRWVAVQIPWTPRP